MSTTSPGPLPAGLRLSSLVRAAGTTATILSGNPPGPIRAAVFAGGAEIAARQIDDVGIQVFSITPDRGSVPTQQEKLIQIATTTVSWVAANLLIARTARILPLPRVVTAVAVGAGVYFLDDTLVGKVKQLEE